MFELEQSLELHQSLSPQQIQSLQILTYNNQELEAFLKNEYFENPLLENTIDKQGEMLQNLETLWEAYVHWGGNGTGKTYYRKIRDLPIVDYVPPESCMNCRNYEDDGK